jgi:predicted nucleic acid-binding protein
MIVVSDTSSKIVGILGVLIQAKQKGVISSAKEYIEKLIEIGFRLDKKLIGQVLKKLGEE